MVAVSGKLESSHEGGGTLEARLASFDLSVSEKMVEVNNVILTAEHIMMNHDGRLQYHAQNIQVLIGTTQDKFEIMAETAQKWQGTIDQMKARISSLEVTTVEHDIETMRVQILSEIKKTSHQKKMTEA